jgi:hypothetical protein
LWRRKRRDLTLRKGRRLSRWLRSWLSSRRKSFKPQLTKILIRILAQSKRKKFQKTHLMSRTRTIIKLMRGLKKTKQLLRSPRKLLHN